MFWFKKVVEAKQKGEYLFLIDEAHNLEKEIIQFGPITVNMKYDRDNQKFHLIFLPVRYNFRLTFK